MMEQAKQQIIKCQNENCERQNDSFGGDNKINGNCYRCQKNLCPKCNLQHGCCQNQYLKCKEQITYTRKTIHDFICKQCKNKYCSKCIDIQIHVCQSEKKVVEKNIKLKCQFSKDCQNFINFEEIKYNCRVCSIYGCQQCYKDHECCQIADCQDQAKNNKKSQPLCSDCDKIYCRICKLDHKNKNLCKKGEEKIIECQQKEQKDNQNKIICRVKYSKFCQKCNILVCIECFQKSHEKQCEIQNKQEKIEPNDELQQELLAKQQQLLINQKENQEQKEQGKKQELKKLTDFEKILSEQLKEKKKPQNELDQESLQLLNEFKSSYNQKLNNNEKCSKNIQYQYQEQDQNKKQEQQQVYQKKSNDQSKINQKKDIIQTDYWGNYQAEKEEQTQKLKQNDQYSQNSNNIDKQSQKQKAKVNLKKIIKSNQCQSCFIPNADKINFCLKCQQELCQICFFHHHQCCQNLECNYKITIDQHQAPNFCSSCKNKFCKKCAKNENILEKCKSCNTFYCFPGDECFNLHRNNCIRPLQSHRIRNYDDEEERDNRKKRQDKNQALMNKQIEIDEEIEENSYKFQLSQRRLKNGLEVIFPFKPYESQTEFMEKLVDAVCQEKHAILESPTGTGKTLSLLCSLLALKREKNDFLIIYVSRTHTQVKQLIKQLKKTSYKPFTTTLGSREKFCINKEIQNEVKQNGTTLNFECKKACKVDMSCGYKQNLESFGQEDFDQKIRDIEELVDFGKEKKICPYYFSWQQAEIADIIFAPYAYILSMDVFDRMLKIGESQNKRLLVVFDEAHNIASQTKSQNSYLMTENEFDESKIIMKKLKDYFKEAVYKLELPKQELKKEMDDLQKQIDDNKLMTTDRIIATRFIEAASNHNLKNKFISEIAVYNQLMIVVESFINSIFKNLDDYKEKILQKHEFDNYRSNRNGDYYLGTGSDIYEIVFSQKMNNQLVKNCIYQVQKVIQILQDEYFIFCNELANIQKFLNETYEFYQNTDQAFVLMMNIKTIKKQERVSFQLLILDPSRIFKQLQGSNTTLIFTSGSLSPLQAFKNELKIQIDNKHMQSFKHVIDVDKNLKAFRIKNGVLGSDLLYTHQNRYHDNVDQQDLLFKDTGFSLIEIVRRVPHGVVIFFSSYAFQNDCVEKWKEISYNKEGISIYDKLDQLKRCFIEPMSQHRVNKEFLKYKKHALKEGALFFAVSRGKLAEGIDFIDDLARAVVIIGVPNLNPKDINTKVNLGYIAQLNDQIDWNNSEISQKTIFQILDMYQNNARYKKHVRHARDYYQNEVTRATNQAIGRCLRHQNDYGIVYMIDSRFCEEASKNKLPEWVKESIQVQNNNLNFDDILQQTEEFFYEKSKQIVRKNSDFYDEQEDLSDESLEISDEEDNQMIGEQRQNQKFESYMSKEDLQKAIEKGDVYKGQLKSLEKGVNIYFIESQNFRMNLVLLNRHFNRAFNQSIVYFKLLDPFQTLMKQIYSRIRKQMKNMNIDDKMSWIQNEIQNQLKKQKENKQQFSNMKFLEEIQDALSKQLENFEIEQQQDSKNFDYEQKKFIQNIMLIIDQRMTEFQDESMVEQYAQVVQIDYNPVKGKKLLGYLEPQMNNKDWFYFYPLDPYLPKMNIDMKLLQQKFQQEFQQNKKSWTCENGFLQNQLFYAEFSLWARTYYPKAKIIEKAPISRQQLQGEKFDRQLLEIYQFDDSQIKKFSAQEIENYRKMYKKRLQQIKDSKSGEDKVENVFTIDSEEAVTLDDAFSINQIEIYDSQQKQQNDFVFQLGIHISDPTVILDEDLIDNAMKRTCNIYLKYLRRVSMIHPDLCDLLSLNKDEEKIVISAYFLINSQGGFKFQKFKQSVVRNVCALKYDEVDEFFQKNQNNNNSYDQNSKLGKLIQKHLLNLRDFSRQQRAEMMKNQMQDFEDIVMGEDYSEASKIVQILMIIANRNMSNLLFQNQEARCSSVFRTNYHEPSQLNGLKQIYKDFFKNDLPDQALKFLRSEIEKKINKDSTFREIIKCKINQFISGRTGFKIGHKDLVNRDFFRHENFNFESYCTYTSPIRKFCDLMNIIALKKIKFDKKQFPQFMKLELYQYLEQKTQMAEQQNQQLENVDVVINRQERIIRQMENMSNRQFFCEQKLLLAPKKEIETRAIILSFDKNKFELIFPEFDRDTQMLLPKYLFFKDINLQFIRFEENDTKQFVFLKRVLQNQNKNGLRENEQDVLMNNKESHQQQQLEYEEIKQEEKENKNNYHRFKQINIQLSQQQEGQKYQDEQLQKGSSEEEEDLQIQNNIQNYFIDDAEEDIQQNLKESSNSNDDNDEEELEIEISKIEKRRSCYEDDDLLENINVLKKQLTSERFEREQDNILQFQKYEKIGIMVTLKNNQNPLQIQFKIIQQ